MNASIQGIFTGAAADCAAMMVPIMSAGAVVFVGMLGFKVGKRILKSSMG